MPLATTGKGGGNDGVGVSSLPPLGARFRALVPATEGKVALAHTAFAPGSHELPTFSPRFGQLEVY
jgi:hypothetical protein